MVEDNDPEAWRRARETYGSSAKQDDDLTSHPKGAHERFYETGESILSIMLTLLKWTGLVILGLTIFAVLIFVAVGAFGLLKFGWTQL